MSPAQKLYRKLLTNLSRRYGGLVQEVIRLGDAVPQESWAGLREDLQEALGFTDIVAASQIQWKAFHQQTIVPPGPGVTVNNIVEENAWLQDQVAHMNPMIEQTAQRVALIEQDYYLRRWRQGKLTEESQAAEKHPLWRLEMFYRTTMGDVAATSQQVRLAHPAVGIHFPFAEYRSREDSKVRPTHAAMDGFVALRSWTGWARARPKNGFNCRCLLRFFSRLESIRKGWMNKDGKPAFETRWPTAASRRNWADGSFPDDGWHGPKFVAGSLPMTAAG